jgi:hypothetical protein
MIAGVSEAPEPITGHINPDAPGAFVLVAAIFGREAARQFIADRPPGGLIFVDGSGGATVRPPPARAVAAAIAPSVTVSQSDVVALLQKVSELSRQNKWALLVYAQTNLYGYFADPDAEAKMALVSTWLLVFWLVLMALSDQEP